MFRKIITVSASVLAGITAVILITLGVLYVSNTGDYTVAATTADDPSLPVILIDDYPFHGETYGDPDNPVVIALHGGPGGDYRSILPLKELADDYFVVFYDQRGSGLSPRVEADECTLEQYVMDLDNMIHRFSPDRPVYIIGHSWGAMLASTYIGRNPESVSKAVLAEPGFLDQNFMEIYNERFTMPKLSQGGTVIKALFRAFGKSLHVKGPDPQARKDFIMLSYMTTPIAENPMSGYYKDRNMENAAGESWRFGSLAANAVRASGFDENGRLIDLAAGVDQWPGEALFLCGSENSIIGPDYQAEQMKRFPGSKLTVIEGAGHTMIGEKPQESLKTIRDFLEE